VRSSTQRSNVPHVALISAANIAVPGKAAAREAAQTYVDLGEIMNGIADEGIADRLRERLARTKSR
jgi:hypothetical protein